MLDMELLSRKNGERYFMAQRETKTVLYFEWMIGLLVGNRTGLASLVNSSSPGFLSAQQHNLEGMRLIEEDRTN